MPPAPFADPTDFLAAIEANIDFLRGQMRQAEQFGTGLLMEAPPSQALFGDLATRTVLASQYIESMVKARDIAQNNPGLLNHWAAQQAAGDAGAAVLLLTGAPALDPAAVQAFAQSMGELMRVINQLTAQQRVAPPVVPGGDADAAELDQLYRDYDYEMQRSMERDPQGYFPRL